jgi:hypothetical protein
MSEARETPSWLWLNRVTKVLPWLLFAVGLLLYGNSLRMAFEHWEFDAPYSDAPAVLYEAAEFRQFLAWLILFATAIVVAWLARQRLPATVLGVAAVMLACYGCFFLFL